MQLLLITAIDMFSLRIQSHNHTLPNARIAAIFGLIGPNGRSCAYAQIEALVPAPRAGADTRSTVR